VFGAERAQHNKGGKKGGKGSRASQARTKKNGKKKKKRVGIGPRKDQKPQKRDDTWNQRWRDFRNKDLGSVKNAERSNFKPTRNPLRIEKKASRSKKGEMDAKSFPPEGWL